MKIHSFLLLITFMFIRFYYILLHFTQLYYVLLEHAANFTNCLNTRAGNSFRNGQQTQGVQVALMGQRH